MRRFGVLALVVSIAAAIVVSSAQAALFFLFEPTTAAANDMVTVRLGGTPASFTLDQREKPFRNGIRLYLVPSRVAGEVGSRFDRRLHFIGRIIPDRKSRGILSFTVPPLDSDDYVVAAWCPGCACYSRGRSFFVQQVPRVSRYRRWMGLRLRLPSAADSCPVSREGRYGNELLSVWVPPDGVLVTRKDEDGYFQKLGWMPHQMFYDHLTVSGERLDTASPPMKVLRVFWGYASSGGNGSWVSAVTFPTEGCWRITGRVGDVSVSYVVQVVAGP